MTATVELTAPGLRRPGHVDLVQTKPRLTVGVDGYGDRDHDSLRKAFETLRPIAWAFHTALRDMGRPGGHHLAPMEALWWTDDRIADGAAHPPLGWRVFVGEQPGVPASLVERVVRDLPTQQGLPAAQLVDVRILDEGLVAQTLHVGSLAEVAVSERVLGEFMREHDLVPAGPRHEIYLSHVRRCDPTHLRTLIRRPVRPAGTAGRGPRSADD